MAPDGLSGPGHVILPLGALVSLTYKMNFIIQQFARVVVTSAKCLTQGLEDSNFSLRGTEMVCVRGTGQSSLSLAVVCPGLPSVAVLNPAVSFPSTSQGLLTDCLV